MSEPGIEKTLLIAFVDLSNYSRLSRQQSAVETFAWIAELAERVGVVVEGAGGRVVKFIGDAALITFEEPLVPQGVAALESLKRSIDGWLEERGLESELQVRAHLGRVAEGPIGSGSDKRLDVIGSAVNEAALLPAGSFVLSPELRRAIAS